MTTENTEETTPPEHQPAPPPAENPRNAIIREIAKSAHALHEAAVAESEAVPSVDDDHNITPAKTAPAEPPAELPSTPSEASSEVPPPEAPAGAPEDAIDPTKDYEVVVEGQKLLVKGATIIDAGKRTLQKEAAADHRLRLASQLLEEAERRVAATPGAAPTQPEPPKSRTEEQLAHALQFGTPEESANAVRELRAGGMSEDKLLKHIEERSRLVAADEFEFRRGQAMLARDFRDIMEKPALRRLFESEDARMLQGGDRRPYVDRYRAIGEQLRKDFGLSKPAAPAPAGAPPAGTPAARQAAKAAAPSVPRTAAARLGEGGGSGTKPIATSDVIAGMAAARGNNRLASPPTKRS